MELLDQSLSAVVDFGERVSDPVGVSRLPRASQLQALLSRDAE
jgi:hypothetical protein